MAFCPLAFVEHVHRSQLAIDGMPEKLNVAVTKQRSSEQFGNSVSVKLLPILQMPRVSHTVPLLAQTIKRRADVIW